MNKVILSGRLVRDPEVRYTGGQNMAIAKFTLAVDRRVKKEGEQNADFINCVAWNKTAEFVSKYFSKGRMIIVIGRISTRSWEGQDGKKNYTTEVIANEVSFGESKRSQDGDFTPSAPADAFTPAAVPQMPQDLADDDFSPLLDTDDDLPF